MTRFLRSWWPAIVWACVIFTLSTDSFSSVHTAALFERIFGWIFSSLTAAQLERLNEVLRKSAHFTVYFIFYLCLFRGIRGGRKGWHWSWALAAWGIAAGYSVFDEIHQAFVASRTASPWDALRDSTGALIGMAILWLVFQLPSTKPPNVANSMSKGASEGTSEAS